MDNTTVRNVIVTGGSRGLGLGTVRTLARSGYRVVAIARRETAELTDAIKATAASGEGAIDFVAFDLERIDDIPDLVKTVRKDFGPIHGLVNNAAIRGVSSIDAISPTDFRRVSGIILDGAYICVKACLPALRASGQGAIVNIGGMSGHTGARG